MDILMHGHHLKLLSVVISAESRIRDIKFLKSPEQQELRLKLLQEVSFDLLPPEIAKKAKIWWEAWEEYKSSPNQIAWDKLGEAYYDFDAVCKKHKEELEVLHTKLCLSKNPDCPWDGERIFPDE